MDAEDGEPDAVVRLFHGASIFGTGNRRYAKFNIRSLCYDMLTVTGQSSPDLSSGLRRRNTEDDFPSFP